MKSTWLPQTKFLAPRLRDDFVSRSRLLDTLLTSVESCSLTLISAPPGYGKTTLLASILDKQLAWVSLDEEDNNLTRFFIVLVMALQKLDSNFGENTQTLISSLENPAAEAGRIVSVLINEIMDGLPATWLVLDDLHLIKEPSIYHALDYLLERIPANLRLIIATRHDPPLSLARLRARGKLAEFRVADLRFTLDEVSSFLNDKQKLTLSSNDMTQLQSRAEGWAAGLRLLAESLDHISTPGDRTAFIRNLTYTDRYVFDFLAEEVLKLQEDAIRAFLLDTSILPELTPELCNILTDRNDSSAVLENLYRRNLFLTLSEDTGWTFRYHALFAEFLREQLKRENSQRFTDLHRRVAEVQMKSAPARAITHFLAAELWGHAAQSIELVSEEFLRQGLLKTLCSWIELLPISVRNIHPRLLYIMGMQALHQGKLNDAIDLLESARLRFIHIGDQSNLAEVLLLMIDTASRQHDYARQADLMQQASAIPLPVHGRVQLLMAQIWQMIYQFEFNQADILVDQVLDIALIANDLRVFNVIAPIMNLHLAFLPSGPERLERYCREVLARFENQVNAINAGTLSLYSILLFLKGSVTDAESFADETHTICNQLGGLAYSDIQAHQVQMQVAGVRGEFAKIELFWRDTLPYIESTTSLKPFVVMALYNLGRAQWMQNKFESARQTNERISTFVDPAEFLEVTVLRHLMIALIEITDRQFENAERELKQAIMIEQKWPLAVIFGSSRLLLAYLYSQTKRESEAWAQFAPVLTDCEQRNMAGLILQETKLAVPLLQLAIKRNYHTDYALQLLNTLSSFTSPRPILVPETGQILTAREVEVLQLIVEGASNQSIANRLVISEHTVKSHLTRLFAKLQVTSRTEAAARAHELNLL